MTTMEPEVLKKPSLLNKSEASAILHSLYDLALELWELEDNHPNFHSIICENIRAPLTTGALKKGRPNGNRSFYGKIDFMRIGSKPMFAESLLQDWFNKYYLPTMMKEAA